MEDQLEPLSEEVQEAIPDEDQDDQIPLSSSIDETQTTKSLIKK